MTESNPALSSQDPDTYPVRQQAGGVPGLGGVAVQPPARQAPVATPFHSDPPAGPPQLQHAGSWQPKPPGPGGLQAPVGSGASSFAASLAPGPPTQQQHQQQLHQHQAMVSSPATESPLLSLDPVSHAPSPHVGGHAQQLGGPSVSQGGELQPSLLHVGGPSQHQHHQHQQHQQQQQQVELQFGQFGLSSGNYSGGGPAGFGGSYSESPAFGEGPPVSAFGETSSSAFLDSAVPVLSTNEAAGAAGGLSHESSGVAGSGASFKGPGAGAGGVPSGRASGEFSQSAGAAQHSGSIRPPMTSTAAIGAAPGQHYSAFAQPKAQELPHSHGSGGQYSQYGGYNQHFGGATAFGQVRPRCPLTTAVTCSGSASSHT